MLHKHELNYDLLEGDIAFAPVTVKDNFVMIQVDYQDIDANDVTVELEQAAYHSGKFDIIANSRVNLDPAKSSHTYNIAGVADGVLIRVVLRTGSATSGIINYLIYLY